MKAVRIAKQDKSSMMKHFSIWHIKIWALFVFALLYTLSGMSQSYPGKYDLTWKTPSGNSFGSMPLGNGDIGMNVWVENNGDLLFYISKVNAYDAAHLLPKLGKVRVQFSPALDVHDCTQTLKLEDGSIRIIAGDVNLRMIVCANQPVISVEGNSKTARKMMVKLEPLRQLQNEEASMPESKTVGILMQTPKNQLAWCYRNLSSDWASHLASQNSAEMVAKTADPILHRTSGCMIEGSKLMKDTPMSMQTHKGDKTFSFVVKILTSQPSNVKAWLTDIRNIGKPDFKAHDAYWQKFWNRSYIDVSGCGTGDVLLNQNLFIQIPQNRTIYQGHDKISAEKNAFQISQRYALERFCEAIASRGEVPPPYNGSIFTMDMPAGTKIFQNVSKAPISPDNRDWGILSFMWQNTRHPYWSMATRGDLDCLLPGMKFVRDGLDIAKDRCRKIFGLDGAFIMEANWMKNVGVFNWDGVPQHLRYHQLATIELPAIMCDYFDHTRDTAFLHQILLPCATEAIKYYANRFPERDTNGKMVMPNVGCVETYQPVTNPCTEIGALKYVLSKLLSYKEIDASVKNKNNWLGLFTAMPSVPIRKVRGLELLAVGDVYKPGRTMCESPELYSVYPFRQAWLGTPEWLSTARQSFHVRTISLDGSSDDQTVETGGWQSAPVQAAYLGLAREAARLTSINFNDDFINWNSSTVGITNWPHRPHPRFPAFWECKMDGTPDNDHGANSENALQSMLLQNDGDKIYLLPAWPEDWDVTFKLCANSNTTVECSYRNGKVEKLVVTPVERTKDIVNMSTENQRIRTLTEVSLSDHNYLFGLPPMLDAAVIPGKTTAAWIQRYGETIKDCKAGPWKNTLFKGCVAYVHVFDWPAEGVFLPNIDRVLIGQKSITGDIKVTKRDNGWLLTGTPDKQHTIVRLEFDEPLLPIAMQKPSVGSYCLNKKYTEKRDSADMIQREVVFDKTVPISRFEITIDNPTHHGGESRPYLLDVQDEKGNWKTVYQGDVYGLICAKAFPKVETKAVRIKAKAEKLTQFDIFGE